jgi:D-tyrosyl-tRNA(Tyr) deacylase
MANYAHGNRPDYLNSAPPAIANELYEFFKSELSSRIGECESGRFGADMRTEMSTDGPVTIVMDSAVLRK